MTAGCCRECGDVAGSATPESGRYAGSVSPPASGGFVAFPQTVLLYHESPVQNREGILERGLLPRRPTWDGNWRSLWFCRAVAADLRAGPSAPAESGLRLVTGPASGDDKATPTPPSRPLGIRLRRTHRTGPVLSRVVRESIPPERLRLLGQWTRGHTQPASRRCETCGQQPDAPLQLHEVRSYHDECGVQKLERLMCLCLRCHEATHPGHVAGRGAEELDWLMHVTGWPERVADRCRPWRSQWEGRSRRDWICHLSLLRDYGIPLPTLLNDRGRQRRPVIGSGR